MRICLVYDCFFPYTVGGAERWYRNLAERLAADGHDVTYLTLRQWERGARAEVPGVRVLSVGPRMNLYAPGGRRRILPPLVFGAGVLWHLARRGRDYDVVHTASFPYFSLLAAGALR
jgi:glycosyltransferase involved in cell wall biosynthesis